MPKFHRSAAVLVTLGLAVAVAGCPGNPASTDPTPRPSGTKSPKPSPTGTGSSKPTASPTASPTVKPSPTPTGGGSTSPSPTPTGSASAGTTTYVQVERLGRPGINEGLIRDNALLNTWNGVGPAVDLTTDGKPIVDEAAATLAAFGNDTAQINTLVGQLLPDVMRIDTTKTSGYATSAGNANPLALDNLSPTKKIPVGGRMMKDDVMDVTLILIVPNGLPGSTTPIAGLESDGVTYDQHHKAVLGDFPYLAAPN